MGLLLVLVLISIPSLTFPSVRQQSELNTFEERCNQSLNHFTLRRVSSLPRMPEVLFIFSCSFKQALSHANHHKVCFLGCWTWASRSQKGGLIEDSIVKVKPGFPLANSCKPVHKTVCVRIALFAFAHCQCSLNLLWVMNVIKIWLWSLNQLLVMRYSKNDNGTI